jgi:hypothetical protein
MCRILVGEVMPGGDEEDLAGSWANVADFYSSLMNP